MVSAISLLPLVSTVLGAVLLLVAIFVPIVHSRSTVFFICLNVASILYSGGYFLRINVTRAMDPALSPGALGYFVFAVNVIGAASLGTYWFLFGAEQTGHTGWTKGWGLVAAHVPLAYTMLAALTNSWHHLFVVGQVGTVVVYGPLARVHHLAGMIMGTLGFWWCLKALWSRPGGRRADAVALGAAAVLPYLGSFVWLTRDLSHVAAEALAAPVLEPAALVVLAVLVFRAGLGDIVPVGTVSAIMENTDALLAYLDPGLVFVSANSAFLERAGMTEREIEGRRFDDVVRNPDLAAVVEHASQLGQRVEQRGWPSALGSDEQASYWNWSLRPVMHKRRVKGSVFSLSEVSDEVREAELAAALSRLTRRLHATLDTERALPRILGTAGNDFGADVSLVLKRGQRFMWVRRCRERDALWETFDEASSTHLRLAMESRRPVVVPDVLDDPRFDAVEAAALRSRRILAVPLIARGKVLGALSFAAPAPGGVAPSQVMFARELARAVATAVENARLYRTEVQIADALQDAIVSLPEQVEGLEAAHAYHSATEAARVGGDFYDVFRLDTGHVGVLIGDVSGKGVQVAALSSVVKNAIRAEALRAGSPAAILGSANGVLLRRLDIGRFATAFLAVLDPLSGSLRYASAGHPAPFVLRADGRIERLGGASTVLGAYENVTYRTERTSLGHGDLLLLFTDGLVEADRSSSDGEDEVAVLLGSLADPAPEAVVAALLERATRASGGELRDDVAILAIRMTPVRTTAEAVPAEA